MNHLKYLFTEDFVELKFTIHFFSVVLLFLILFGTKATCDALCPPDLNQWPQQDYTSYFEPIPSESWGWVNYKTRESGGRTEIKVDWGTLYNTGRYGLTNDELKQIMYKAIIVDIAGRHCENLQGQKQFVFFEVTQCQELRHCYLHLIMNNEVFCSDEGWPGPNPAYFTYQNEHYYKLNNYVICGTQCCEFIYTVECAQNPVGAGNYVHIISFSKTPYPNSSCPTSSDTDCLTGDPEPCESTCN